MFIGGKSKEIAFPSGVSFKKLTAKGTQTKFINIRIPIIDQKLLPSKKKQHEKEGNTVQGENKTKEKQEGRQSDKEKEKEKEKENDKEQGSGDISVVKTNKKKKKQKGKQNATWEDVEDRQFLSEVHEWLGMMSLNVTRYDHNATCNTTQHNAHNIYTKIGCSRLHYFERTPSSSTSISQV